MKTIEEVIYGREYIAHKIEESYFPWRGIAIDPAWIAEDYGAVRSFLKKSPLSYYFGDYAPSIDYGARHHVLLMSPTWYVFVAHYQKLEKYP